MDQSVASDSLRRLEQSMSSEPPEIGENNGGRMTILNEFMNLVIFILIVLAGMLIGARNPPKHVYHNRGIKCSTCDENF